MKDSKQQMQQNRPQSEGTGPREPELTRRPISQAPIGSMSASELKAIFDPIEMF
ncbi:MAG: hypothetical protein ACRDIU_02770 [Actinomycetota bacterium]